jgi:hypothetical protein
MFASSCWGEHLDLRRRKCRRVDKYVKKVSLFVFFTQYFLSMAQQPLVCQDLLIIEGFTITLRHTTLGRTPLDE